MRFAWIALLLASSAWADEVTLQDGRKLTGIVRKTDAKKIELEVGVGTLWLDRKDVLSVNPGRTALHEYYEKWESVKGSSKVDDWVELAKFARDNKLGKFLKTLMEGVLKLDAENEEARRFLGFEKVQGRWMTHEEAFRARGMIEFEGRWMSPAEKELIVSRRLAAKLKAQEEADERRQKREAEELARTLRENEMRARVQTDEGCWCRPSEFWPYYYRGPRRTYYNPYGYFDAIPTINIFDVIPKPSFPGNVKK